MRFSKQMMSGLLALAFTIVTPALARAEDDDPVPTPSTDSGDDHADPANKTLPSHASATAQANAFGQQGERQKAAHQAARAAATEEAGRATHDAAATNPANQTSHAAGNAHGANSHAQKGQQRAAAARASRAANAASQARLDRAAQAQASQAPPSHRSGK